MHAMLTLTLMHDRYLSGTAHTPLSVIEAFHWQQSLQMYIRKLSGPLKPSDMDCVWATGAIMCVTTFSHLEAQTPWEAWPLKASSPLDLNWLKIAEGKKQFLERMQSTTTTGALLNQTAVSILLDESAISVFDGLPYEMVTLLGLDDPTSNYDNNPYYFTASSLGTVLASESKRDIVLNYIRFLITMNSRFRKLLESKDSRALLLQAYWYAKLLQYPHWWIHRRAQLECEDICIYLKIHHSDNVAIQNLLRYPRSMTGMATFQDYVTQ